MAELNLNAEDSAIYDAFGRGERQDLNGISSDGLKAILAGVAPSEPAPGIFEKTGSAIANAPSDVAKWMSGANVQYPEVPIGAAPTTATASQKAKYLALISSTLDDYKLEAGIQNIFPGAMTTYDNKGNLLVSLESKDEKGQPLGWSTFYPNPRGLDKSTILQLSGAIAGAAPVEAALSLSPLIGIGSKVLTRGYRGAAVTAATETALTERVSASITGLPYDWSAPGSALVFGPTFLGLGKLLGKSAGYIIDKYKANPASVINADGTLTTAARDYITAQGLNPDDIQGSLFTAFKQLVDSGAIPSEAAVRAQANGLPVPVLLTTGQQTRDNGQMLWEDMIAKGMNESQATEVLRAFYKAQVVAVKENIAIISEGIGVKPIRGSAAEEAQKILIDQRDAARATANAKYTAARKYQQVFLDPSSAQNLAGDLDVKLGSFNRSTTPKTWLLVDEIKDGLAKGMDVDTINTYRQQLRNAANEMGPEGMAARTAIDAVDNYLDDVVKSNLFQQTDMFGNAVEGEAIRLWKDAINTWSGFKNRWETAGILNDLTEETMRDGKFQPKVSPADAVNYIFAVNFLNIVNKKNIVRDLQVLKEQLPAEYWNSLRGEVVTKLFDGTLTKTSDEAAEQISGKFNKDWAIFRRSNQPLVNLLFTSAEQAQIGSLASVSGRIADRTVNRSNTTSAAMAIGAAAGRVFNSLGLPVATGVIANILSTTLGPVVRAGRAVSATSGIMTPPRINPIIIGGASSVSADPAGQQKASAVIENVPLIGPSIAPLFAPNYRSPAPDTRGLRFMNPQASAAPPPPAPASPQSRQMLQQLFPNDAVLQALQPTA